MGNRGLTNTAPEDSPPVNSAHHIAEFHGGANVQVIGPDDPELPIPVHPLVAHPHPLASVITSDLQRVHLGPAANQPEGPYLRQLLRMDGRVTASEGCCE